MQQPHTGKSNTGAVCFKFDSAFAYQPSLMLLHFRHKFEFSFVAMNDTSDLDRQIEQLKRCEIIKESEVKALCAKAREILVEESNVQRVDSPVIVSVENAEFVANIGKYEILQSSKVTEAMQSACVVVRVSYIL